MLVLRGILRRSARSSQQVKRQKIKNLRGNRISGLIELRDSPESPSIEAKLNEVSSDKFCKLGDKKDFLELRDSSRHSRPKEMQVQYEV